MPCYCPLKGWRAAKRNESGKHGIVFSLADGYKDKPVEVPCGQCIGCRLSRARQWAVRCVHEASLYEENCFVTLTYDDEHYPEQGSLNVRDIQLFLKRLREKYTGQTIRFFQCGEYGELNERPHHHVLLFNYRPDDLKRFSSTVKYSPALEKLWPHGMNAVGEVTFQSAAYVASYCVKKVTGSRAEAHYQGRKPEFVTMSRRPGIGRLWFDKFASDSVYKSRAAPLVLRGGVYTKVPRYYDELFAASNPDKMALIKMRRKLLAMRSPDNVPGRVIVRGELNFLTVKARMAERKLQ